MKKTNKKIGAFCAVFDRSTRLYEVDQFVDKFRNETDKKDEMLDWQLYTGSLKKKPSKLKIIK